MRTLGKRLACLGLATLCIGFATRADAQQSDTEDLKALIQSLKEQVESLEQRVEALQENQAKSGDVAERVETLEASLGDFDPGPTDMRVYWKEGLRLDSHDGRFKLKIGGRFHNDWAWFDQDKDLEWLWNPNAQSAFYEDTEDGTEMRRARLALSGTIYDNLDFKLQFDFAGGDADFKDVWMAYKGLPGVGTVKAGHFKEPFSLEELVSSNDTTFMERALPNVFAPSRNTGVQIGNNHFDERLTWAVGVFRNTDDFGNRSNDGEYAVTGRVTGLPYYTDEGRKLIHLGASYSTREIDNTLRIRQRPEVHLSPVRFLDTGTLFVEDMDLLGLEAAAVWGPFSLQGEYMTADVQTRFTGNHNYDGYYAQASYFITGESRPYKKSAGVFTKITPKNNFNVREGAWGAWEVAARYSVLDLDHDGIPFGGEEKNFTIGLNWYLNPNARVMFNYVHADIDHGALYKGDLNTLQTRFQLSF